MTKPTSKVRSPTAGWCLGTQPTYSVWLLNSQIDTTIPTAMATGPAQLRCLWSNSRSPTWCPRRSSWSVRKTASQGPIQ